MPRPVEALPWGSRSTISTGSPAAASAVPRLIAVVVLPTPPFWLTTARTRAEALRLGSASRGVCSAGRDTVCSPLGGDDPQYLAAGACHARQRFCVQGP